MKPSEISLFNKKDQTLLVTTEPQRLEKLNEDDLGGLLDRVRRARDKYTDVHRRRSGATIRASGKRASAATSNERTLRQAEIFEDAVSRVARHLSRAARTSATELKAERLTAASKTKKSAPSKKAAPANKKRPTGSKSGKKATPVVKSERVGATSASNKQSQARKDGRK